MPLIRRVRAVAFGALIAFLCAAVPSGPGAQAPTPAPAPPPATAEEGVITVVPPYLRGIDLDKPAQEAFKSWPSQDLIERPYWLPWGPLTFLRASVFEQPICLILSVPWNHSEQLMQKGALADHEVLRFLNANFVSVAVRADRRPDIHARYGTGTWPVLALLLSDGSPMLSKANTKGLALPITLGYSEKTGVLFHLTDGRKYYDKWRSFLQGLAEVYEKRVDVEEAREGPATDAAVDSFTRWLLGNFDAKNGGFGAAPKTYPDGFMELAAERADAGAGTLSVPARTTLQKWSAGPLHDTVGGGFHRLAAAPDWGAIQYEKLLEVNAGIARELALALRQKDDPGLRTALAGIVRLFTTTLARPEGGFWNAVEADPGSVDGGGYYHAADRAAAPAPPIDRVVFTGPNALAGASLLRAGAVLGDASAEAAGRAALDFVVENGIPPGRGARHVIEARPDLGRFLVTQADVAFALLDGYECTGDRKYLQAASGIATFVEGNLKVGTETAYRDHLSLGHEAGMLEMPFRPMADNARFARVLVRLEEHGAITDGKKEAIAILGGYAGDLTISGARAIEAALAVQEALAPPMTVTIEGPQDAPATRALRHEALALPQGYLIVKTAAGGKTGATLAWRGAQRRVDKPADLVAAWKTLSTSVGAAR